jgi:hypothetical protein
VIKHRPGITILKGFWLAITGNLKSVNEQVYGEGKPKKSE